MNHGLTPPQTAGPFFHIGLLHDGLNVLASEGTLGTRVRIEGHIYDGDRHPIKDAAVEIWQANARGRYRHPADSRAVPLDEAFVGFGRAGTDDQGFYWFETIKPGAVPFGEGHHQAPHINVTVYARGLLHHLCTRLYFADEAGNETDPILRLIPAERRATLIASRLSQPDVVYRFDILLQSEGETVFFDL